MPDSNLGNAQLGDLQLGGVGAGSSGPPTFAPAAASLAYTGGTPTLAFSGTITLAPAAAILSYTGGLPNVAVGGIGPGPATLAFTGGTPTVSFTGGAAPLAPGPATLIYRTYTPGVSSVLTTAAGNQLFIGGVSYGTWLEGTFKIDKNIATTYTASVSLRYRSGSKPAVKQDVAMFWGGVKRFGGLVQQVDESSIQGDPFESQLDLTLTGYGSYLDRTVVAKLYTIPIGGSVAVILFDLWAQHLAPLGVSYAYGPNPSVDILDTLFHYITTRQACTVLTDQTPGWSIWIDNNKALQLQQTSAGGGGVAPFVLNRAGLVGINAEAGDTIKLTTSDTLFRNREWVLPSTNLAALVTDNWTGDGVTTAFQTVYALTAPPIVTVAGVLQAVDALGTWTGAPCWYVPNGDGVFFHVAPAAAAAIAISYPAPFQLAFSAQDDPSIAAVGLYEHVTQAQNVTDVATATGMAQALLALYGPGAASPVSISLAYNSAQQPAWLEPGMLMTVAWTFPDIAGAFVIQEVQSEEQGLSLWRHTVTMALGPTGDLTGAADLQALSAQLPQPQNTNTESAGFNLGTTVVGNTNPGLSTGRVNAVYIFVYDGVFSYWSINFPTAPPTGSDLVIDALLNGVSIFKTPQWIDLPAGQTTEQRGITFASPNLAYKAGDQLTLNVLQAGSTFGGADGTVRIVGLR